MRRSVHARLALEKPYVRFRALQPSFNLPGLKYGNVTLAGAGSGWRFLSGQLSPELSDFLLFRPDALQLNGDVHGHIAWRQRHGRHFVAVFAAALAESKNIIARSTPTLRATAIGQAPDSHMRAGGFVVGAAERPGNLLYHDRWRRSAVAFLHGCHDDHG